MAKKIIGGIAGIFGKKKRKASATEESGPIITPLDGAKAKRGTGVGIMGALRAAQQRQQQATILSDKLGN